MLDDSLEQNTQDYNWLESNNCVFRDGSYHASIAESNHSAFCLAQKPLLTNFVFQVRMTIIAGDKGGIFFRANSVSNFTIIFIFG